MKGRKIVKIEVSKLERDIVDVLLTVPVAKYYQNYIPMLKTIWKAQERAYEKTGMNNAVDIWYINWWFGNQTYSHSLEEDKELFSEVWRKISERLEEGTAVAY